MSLIDDIRSGSNEAIKQLYQENAQDVYDFAKGITGNHDTAMQATKSTLAKLVQQIQSGKTPANLHSEALKLAYDEACKIAMPSVENVKSPYEEEEEETVPTKEKRRKPEPRPARKKERVYDDGYDDDGLYDDGDDYEEAPRRQAKNGRRDNARPQPERSRRSNYRDDYDDYNDYDRDDRYRRNDRYDDYDRYDDRYDDDYDDYEVKGRGAGFYICLIINIILVLLLIWFLIGLLINLGVLPDNLYDMLGYGWFNEHIYRLF